MPKFLAQTHFFFRHSQTQLPRGFPEAPKSPRSPQAAPSAPRSPQKPPEATRSQRPRSTPSPWKQQVAAMEAQRPGWNWSLPAQSPREPRNTRFCIVFLMVLTHTWDTGFGRGTSLRRRLGWHPLGTPVLHWHKPQKKADKNRYYTCCCRRAAGGRSVGRGREFNN